MMQDNPDGAIQPSDRNHPGHTDLIRARVDDLARHISKGKFDPALPGKRAKEWWAKAYNHFRMMQDSPGWWKQKQSEQYAIIHPEGGEPLDYRELDVAYPSLPKHEIDVAKLHADLAAGIAGATLSEDDVKHIQTYLGSFERKIGWPLWSELRRNYRALERIASGKLDGHGTEFSGAFDFDPPVEDLAAEYDVKEPTVAALRAGLYVLLQKQGSLSHSQSPVDLFRAIGVEPKWRPRRTGKQTKAAETFG